MDQGVAGTIASGGHGGHGGGYGHSSHGIGTACIVKVGALKTQSYADSFIHSPNAYSLFTKPAHQMYWRHE